ncbi:hypothetical protein TRIATDRAFT_254952 [Trichoderma atroviride IMI 206040]|uniref:Uncharacterized protein n=1 Tax=Hypocrea atroviridis (strain ATCC 20476 / IMI 206040) TaxID=452589 RepID=G9NIY0_HYPAI|nr:uncharacterized protein TRIATDRAFT_254952 [Trichoderma atroviride IMI 206040]EHK49736.1 hypothetical protein TRIATDRAFT_254952 [Trichoderma atroviride IMI 206040]
MRLLREGKQYRVFGRRRGYLKFLAGRSCGYRVAFMGSFRIFAESNTSSLVTLRYYINKTNILIPF